MKNLFLLFAALILSMTLSAQTYIRKTLVVKNHTTDFRTKLYANTLVLDSTTNVLYLFPTGAESTDKLDSIIDKQIIGGTFTDVITLDSSDIKYLNSTPVTLLASPGTGYVNIVTNVTVDYDRVNADYTGDSTLAVYYTGLGSYMEAGNAIDGSADKMNTFVYAATPPLNKALAFLIKSKTSNPVGATAAGTLKVYVTYKRQKIQ